MCLTTILSEEEEEEEEEEVQEMAKYGNVLDLSSNLAKKT